MNTIIRYNFGNMEIKELPKKAIDYRNVFKGQPYETTLSMRIYND